MEQKKQNVATVNPSVDADWYYFHSANVFSFRDVRASEIDCRLQTVTEQGVSLLLYKDARVDQSILDETVGPLNWSRSHEMIGDRLYCTVSIYDPRTGQWVSKMDVGTESYTEKEKGQASDSFKRACFNWGIGRELYTAPFIWIPSGKGCTVSSNGRGGFICKDRFSVSDLVIKDKRIASLSIMNVRTKAVVYRFG